MSRWLVIRVRQVPISFQIDRRVPLVLLGLALLNGMALVISVGQGEYPIAPLDTLRTLLGLPTDNPNFAFILQTLRLPRALTAFFVGMGLAIAGALLQGLTRNPLAAPDIIGINAGAGLAAVSLIVFFPATPVFAIPFAAFGGALLVAGSIYLLAWNRGSSSIRLILVGIGIAAIANALTTVMITLGEIRNVSQALIWMTGSVYGRSWEHLLPLLPWLLILAPLAWFLSQDLNVLQLGDEIAQGVGMPVEQQRTLLLLTSVAIAGATVATAGTIGFVGLMAPHVSRQLVGPSHQGLLPTTALTGGLMVVFADVLGRSLFAPIELPCGVVTAAVGAPYFLYLLYRNRN